MELVLMIIKIHVKHVNIQRIIDIKEFFDKVQPTL
ncbi:hypothetical protein PRO82_001329 [Candidatus Protochlamydia amoebophila]|nr:hypothetical protein [Candidatus Protochlamydia amoebophila]